MFLHKITLPDGTALDSSVIRSVQLTEQVNDNTDLCPGAACAACAEIELWAPRNGLTIAQGTEIALVRIDAESDAQTPVGVFLAEKPVKASANVIKVTAYDRMTLLDKDLSPWLREQQGAFPMTVKALVQAVCAQCGVEIVPGNLEAQVNTGYSVPAFYTDDLTGRQIIQWAAQAMCRFARMTPAGQLEFAWYTDHARSGIGPGAGSAWTALDLSGQLLATVDGEVWTFAQPQAGYFTGMLSYEDYTTAPIDKVQIRQSDDDVGVIYPPDEAGTNALVLQGNLLLATQTADALRPVARAIFEQMQGVTYTPLQVSIPLDAGAPAPGEIITVTDAYGRTMQAYIMQRTISGQKVTLESTGNARRDGTAAVNEQKYTNLDGKILEIKTSVDGLTVTAGNLQDDYTQLSQTINGLELTVVKDGEVRTAFAADSSSVTISSGVISFASNSITIDSSNFKLDRNGNVTATGTFSSNNGVTGSGRNEAVLTSGSLTLYRTLSNGQNTMSAQLYSEGSNAAMSRLRMLGSTGVEMVTLYTDYDGSHMSLRNGGGHGAITFNGGTGSAEFEGNVDVQGPVGLGVTTTVNCQNLHCWGEKSRVVRTSVGAVKMAALESPEPCFADSGSAQLDNDGLCLLELHPVFAETLDKSMSLRWLITPAAEGTAWVEKRDDCVLVHGTPGLDFDWLCIGTQRGYAGVYAERCYEQQPISTPDAERELDMLQDLDYEDGKDMESMLDSYGCETFPLLLKGDEPQ